LVVRGVPMWHSEVVVFPVLATAQGVSLRGAMYAITNTL
jgi:formate-dependent nitrite reductase membrane component NrfD